MSETEPIRVLVADGQRVSRERMRHALERSGVATVVAETGDGGEAIELARETRPDVVLMDLRLPTVSGIDAIRQIVEEAPHVRVLVLGASGAASDVLEAVQFGASGYLVKGATSAEISSAVVRASRGEPSLTSPLASLVLSEFRRGAHPTAGDPGLTSRESEILRLLARGHTHGEIAEQLFISRKTLRNHLQNILRKLQLRKRS